jgi:hypothetical protein
MIARWAKRTQNYVLLYKSTFFAGRCPAPYQRIKNPLESHVGNNMRSQLACGGSPPLLYDLPKEHVPLETSRRANVPPMPEFLCHCEALAEGPRMCGRSSWLPPRGKLSRLQGVTDEGILSFSLPPLSSQREEWGEVSCRTAARR